MDKYPTYLIHFNKNHSPKNGQFTNGDGDGDGLTGDRYNYKKNKKLAKYSGEGARANLAKDGTYKVRKNLEKGLSKAKNTEHRDAAEKYRADAQKTAERLAKKKFDEMKKKDKSLDEYDYEDMVDDFFEKNFNDSTFQTMRIQDLGYDEESAAFIQKYLHNPWIS